MKISKSRILVVAGPTSSGKSDLAISIARKLNGEIISADSRQVYRGMDLGTGKVTTREQKLARHWLLDVASPKRQYSVAQWKRAAQRAITDIVCRGKLPIICGGTGFWIDSLVYDTSIPDVKPNAAVRAQLQKLTTAQLFARLQKLDSARAAAIDQHNPARLIRALEIVMATGKPVPPLRKTSPYNVLYLGISVPQQTLNRRIERRLDARLKAGMIKEIKNLHASGVSWKRLESFGLEYRFIARYLQGKLSRHDMRDQLLCATIQYSKRQLTWWRTNNDIKWITSTTQAMRLVRARLLLQPQELRRA